MGRPLVADRHAQKLAEKRRVEAGAWSRGGMSGHKERFVETPAGTTRVWEKGKGRKVGYLAGLNGLPKWSPFLDKLAESRRVVVPSHPRARSRPRRRSE